MPKTCVIYVTRNGHSRALAVEMGKRLGAPVHEIVDLVNRKGLIGYVRAGAQATMKKATAIKDPGVDLAGVKTVVLVQPVWASAVCPPLRSWLNAHRGELGGVRLALLSSNMGSPAAGVRAKWEAEFGTLCGPLAAFAVVAQKLGEQERSRLIDSFAASL